MLRRLVGLAGLRSHFRSVASVRLPRCLERVGEADLLQAFINQNKIHLSRVRLIYLRGEEARVEAGIEKQEIEAALDIERSDHPLN
jgi:hypothetical protein